MRAFNVACPRQWNIYQISSLTTCNLRAYRQASELRLLFHLDYFTFVRTASSPRLLYLAASWLVAWRFLGGELAGGETHWWRDDRIPWQGIETIKHIHIHIRYTSTFTRKSIRWKSKDVEIKRCENCSSRNLSYNSLECWHCWRHVHRRMFEIAKTLKLKFKFMFGWKGIDRSIYEISMFYSFRLF